MHLLWEEQIKHEMESKRNLGKHMFFYGHVFVSLIASVLPSLVYFIVIVCTKVLIKSL